MIDCAADVRAEVNNPLQGLSELGHILEPLPRTRLSLITVTTLLLQLDQVLSEHSEYLHYNLLYVKDTTVEITRPPTGVGTATQNALEN